MIRNNELLTLLTATVRPEGAIRTAESIQRATTPHGWEIRHVIAYYPYEPEPINERRSAWATDLMKGVRDGWVMWLDDDNLLHPDLPKRLGELVDGASSDVGAFVFDCQYPEVAHGLLRAQPQNMRPGGVDGGQVVLWHWFAQEFPWPVGTCADGEWLNTLYRAKPDAFQFVNEALTYHNAQEWLCPPPTHKRSTRPPMRALRRTARARVCGPRSAERPA
jgi:hypothetical protein